MKVTLSSGLSPFVLLAPYHSLVSSLQSTLQLTQRRSYSVEEQASWRCWVWLDPSTSSPKGRQGKLGLPSLLWSGR